MTSSKATRIYYKNEPDLFTGEFLLFREWQKHSPDVSASLMLAEYGPERRKCFFAVLEYGVQTFSGVVFSRADWEDWGRKEFGYSYFTVAGMPCCEFVAKDMFGDAEGGQETEAGESQAAG